MLPPRPVNERADHVQVILDAIDRSPDADHTLTHAIDLAESEHAPLNSL
jgi:hypothetical protein